MFGRGPLAQRARRPWLAAVLGLFALLLQAHAPVAATRMAVDGAGDAGICSIHPGRHGDAGDARGAPGKAALCASCVICHLAAPTPLVEAVLPPAPMASGPAPLAIRRDASPRAPPAIEARARGPPPVA